MDINPKNNFVKWNEHFVEKYNIDDYYKKSNFFVRFIEQKRIKQIISLSKPKSSDKIIELGCGAGHILDKIKAGELFGVDISEHMIKKAKERLKDRAVLYLGDCQNLQLAIKSQKFDKIIISEVLEHVPSPEKVVEQAVSIMQNAGSIVISIPNENLINKIKGFLRAVKILNRFFGNLSKKMDEEWHLHKFDLRLLKQITKGKLKIIKVKRIPFFFLPIRYVVKFQKT